MSLPKHITDNLRTIPFNPSILSNDPELSYILSFAEHPISNESVPFHPRDSYQSPLSQYQFADFDDATFDHLLQETNKNYKQKNVSVVKGIRSSFKQFYARVSALTYQSALKFNQVNVIKTENSFFTSKIDLDYRVQAMKGNIPAKWPQGLKQFNKELDSMPWNAFSSESQIFLQEFINQIKRSVTNQIKKVKNSKQAQRQVLFNELNKMLQTLINISLRSLNQVFILSQISFISQILSQNSQISQQQQRKVCMNLSNFTCQFLQKIPSQSPQSSLHHIQNPWSSNSFLIMKKSHYQKQSNHQFCSITTDGSYLYIYVVGINGIMIKVGTGNGSTIAGKVYLERDMGAQVGVKLDQVNWVYLKAKIYLRNFNKDPYILDVIDPDNFRNIGTVQLVCRSLFGHPTLNILNKNSILMTDGEHLFFLGKRIKIVKSNQNIINGQKKQQAQSLDPKSVKKQKKKKKNQQKQVNNQVPGVQNDQSEQSCRSIQFILVRFQIPCQNSQSTQPLDTQSINQLYQSFNGYFTHQQCIRAYVLNHYDVMQACQWLFDQGTKEKKDGIRIFTSTNVLVLCQAEITSNFNQKSFKNLNQILLKDNSLLYMQNINQSIWTMDHDQVTCYSQNGIKIFSKKEIDSNVDSQKTKLHKNSNLLIIKQGKNPRNPDYYYIHDPYNGVFYTFSWFSQGHFFPCPVLVSNDKKFQIQTILHKRSSRSVQKPERICQLGRYILIELSLLQNISQKNYRFNDPLWWYGQRLNQLNQQGNVSYQEKKKISNKKSKIMTKLNKINQLTKRYQKDIQDFNQNAKVLRQIVKINPYCSDGTIQNLAFIFKFFNGIQTQSNNSLIASFLMVLDRWLTNIPYQITTQIREKLNKILQTLLIIRKGSSTCQANKLSINKIMVSNFQNFYSNSSQAIIFLIDLPHNQIDLFLSCFNQSNSSNKKQSILYQLNKKQDIIQKYDSKYNFMGLFKNKSNVKMTRDNVISTIMVRKDNISTQLHLSLLHFIQDTLIKATSNNTSTFFITLFAQTFKYLTAQTNKNQDNLVHLEHLFEDSFKILQKCLSSCSMQKIIQLTECVSFVVQVYYSSIVRTFGNQNIIKSLLHIIQVLQKPQLPELCKLMSSLTFQGISPCQQKLYQTSHPLERGKSQSYPSSIYPLASCLLLQFDKRCQSDPNHDIMTIQLLHGQQPVGNGIPINDGVWVSQLRLTGKVELKRPVMVLGNRITVEFSSSGHAKDAQSFGRFGFKFGLRPVMAGKLIYDQKYKPKILKTFGTQHNFKYFVNTLKFLVVAASSSIQSLLTIQTDKCQQNIITLLKGKIIRQGLQQPKKASPTLTHQMQINDFLKSTPQSIQLQILQKLNLPFLLPTKQQTISPQPKQLWTSQGIPAYIKGYIEQIKNFKGDFIQVFKQAREHAQPQGSYQHQLRRPGFLQHFKELWLKGEAILFLTVLKHSGLLHLNLKFSIQYIKQNLKAFEQARNGIFYSFITRMQTVREWRDLIQTYHAKSQVEQQQEKMQQKPVQKAGSKDSISIRKNNRIIRTVQLNNPKAAVNAPKPLKKVLPKGQDKKNQQLNAQSLKQIQSQIRQRLNNQFLIQQLCTLKKIKFIPNNMYQNVTSILQQIRKQDPNSKANSQSVYIEPIQHLIQGCLFLLACKSPSTKETLEEDRDIVPMGLARSLSSDQRNANNNKVQLFREWLENWKMWKGFKKENKIQLKYPVLQIADFINSWSSITQVKASISQRSKICGYRISFYKYMTQLLKITSQNMLFAKYAFGSQLLNISSCYKQNLQSASTIKLQSLSTAYTQYTQCLKQLQLKLIRDQIPLTFTKYKQQINSLCVNKAGNLGHLQDKKFLERLKTNTEVLYLLQSQNVNMSLDLALFFVGFKFLSNQNQELLFLANLIVQRALLVEHKIDLLLKTIKKQVGANSLLAKRWKDFIFIQRLSFLFRKLQIVVRKSNLQIDQKSSVAQTIFYVLNLVDVPFIYKVGLKVLKKLKDINLSTAPTPYSQRYKSLKIQQQKVITHKFLSIQSQSHSLSNPQLLSQKSQQIFCPHKNQIQKLLLSQQQIPILQQKSSQSQSVQQEHKNNYNIVLNLHQEEDLVWFTRVLYYLEEVERQAGKGTINDWKSYKQYAEAKQNKQNKKNQQQLLKQANNPNNANNLIQQQQSLINTQIQQPKIVKPIQIVSKQQVTRQRLLANIPCRLTEFQSGLQQQFPSGWYLSYRNIYKPLTSHRYYSKVQKKVQTKSKQNAAKVSYNSNNPVNPGNKKAWVSTLALKLSKKFQQFNNKPLEQPKQGDSQQVKEQFIKAKNFIMRMRKHLAEMIALINQFTNFGYVVFRLDIPKDKAIEICQIVAMGIENRLNPIPFRFEKDEYKNRITIDDNVQTPSKMKITLIGNQDYQIFEQLISLESIIPIQNDHQLASFTQINKRQYVIEDSVYLPFQDFIKVQGAQSEGLQFSKEFIDSKIFKMKKRQQQVYLPDYPKLKYFICQGGINSGLKSTTLIPASQSSLTLQSTPLQSILAQPATSTQPQQQSQFPQQIISKLITLIQEKVISHQVKTKEQVMNYLLACFYLKKLTKMDLGFVDKDMLKELAQALIRINHQGYRSFQPIQHYQNQMQNLLIKLIDNDHQKLKIFEVFNNSDYSILPSIQTFISKKQAVQNKDVIKIATEQQSFTASHYPKSAYLLKSQPPQIEQNKLLKYWQKNILPKIYQFVKTTLRPIEIEDFFQQMRIPLRKNDQMQSKKIAYVICDNKLPQGAVLPDSNHNWNSFSLQDITIGQYALVKLPKNLLDSTTPLIMTGNQQYRLVKIIFIQGKNSSVLVRYRIQEYGLMGFCWVGINSLVRVEKQIMHLSPKDLYTQIQKNLKGMIDGYSKLCLTQLTSVSNIDQSKLIKQTITDMFVHDPIYGWLKQTKHEWSMRNNLKKLMNNNKLQIIEYLQKQFCPIMSYQTDLFAQQAIKLNRFSNITSLILSFKKTACISLTSGLKFFSDPYLFSEIHHCYTTKSQKSDFQPLIFNNPNIYSKYYTNKQCLKIADQNKYLPKCIGVIVFGITEIWTVGGYIGMVVAEIAREDPKEQYLGILKRLNTIFVKWILQKKVAVLCGILAKLVAKITNTIIFIQDKLNIKTTYQSLGVNQESMKKLIQWIRVLLLEQQRTPLALYSQLLQDLSQMAVVFLQKLYISGKSQPIPQHLQQMISLSKVFILIENPKCLNPSQCPQISSQWQRFLQISSIPQYIDRIELLNKMKQILKQNKGKILCPKYDIFLKDNQLIICVEGWNITQLVEEEIMEKIQKQDQEQKQQDEAQNLIMQWSCDACTMINQMGNTHCQVCGAQMPPPPVAKQIYEQVKATDVSKAQTKLKQLQGKRFEVIKQEIHKYFHTYWQNYCVKTEKDNKQLQIQAANKQVLQNANKKKKNVINEPQIKKEITKTQMPKKPQISIKTGSSIINHEIFQDFLCYRFKDFKENIKKLVQSQTTYLGKFKKLQLLGYDLWCDQIYSQQPSLIPFCHLHQLMNYIQGQICKGSSSVLSYSQNSIRLLNSIPLLSSQQSPINYQVQNNIGVKTKYKNLGELKAYNVRYSWKVVKELNVAASKCLQFVNMNLACYQQTQTKYQQAQTTRNNRIDCLGYKVKNYRNLIMGAIKLQLNQKIVQKTSVLRESEEIPKIYLERLKVREERTKDHKPLSMRDKDEYLITKSYQQFAKISPAMLRPFKPKGTDPYLCFSITFRGQNAMGEAGPYRQFFTDISSQLDPKMNLGFFIPSPNNRHNSGQSKSKWLINPKANSSYHLSIYQYIGILMGCCIRTGTHLALDLPKIFWKLIVGEQVTDVDLQEVDHQFVENLRMIRDIPNEDMFIQLQEYYQPIRWTFRTSDDDEHEIIHNGKTIQVTYQDRQKYITQVKNKRIHQSSLQINRIKKGLQQLMPEPYFNCITADEIKLMVCGRPKVDVQLLKKHTKYAGGMTQQDSRIKFFWEVMNQLDEPQKLKVIKFCWGQQRLPINSEQFERNNIRFMIKPMINKVNQDQALPKADTCFFNIELPNYSTKDIMKQRLLLAVNLDCVSINADQNFNPQDNPLMGQVNEDDYEDEEDIEE